MRIFTYIILSLKEVVKKVLDWHEERGIMESISQVKFLEDSEQIMLGKEVVGSKKCQSDGFFEQNSVRRDQAIFAWALSCHAM